MITFPWQYRLRNKKQIVTLAASVLCADRGDDNPKHGSFAGSKGKSCCGVCFDEMYPVLRRGGRRRK